SWLMALRASGRLRVMRRTRPRRSMRTSSAMRLSFSPWPALPRWHPDAAVDPHDFAVHVVVGQQLDDHRGQLVGRAEAVGEQDALTQLGLEGVGPLARPVDRVSMSPGVTVLTRMPWA